MSKIGNKKDPLPNEILDELINCVLGFDNLEDSLNKYFTKDHIRENDALNKYFKNDIGDKLRQYILLDKCRKLSKAHEKTLDEDGLLTILRNILKQRNYKLVGSNNTYGTIKKRVYIICDKNTA